MKLIIIIGNRKGIQKHPINYQDAKDASCVFVGESEGWDNGLCELLRFFARNVH